MITSPKNPFLKDMRRSRRCKGDRALLEGPHLLAEALAAGFVPETVLATPEVLDNPTHQALLDRLPRPPLPIDPRLLAEVSDADSPAASPPSCPSPEAESRSCPAPRAASTSTSTACKTPATWAPWPAPPKPPAPPASPWAQAPSTPTTPAPSAPPPAACSASPLPAPSLPMPSTSTSNPTHPAGSPSPPAAAPTSTPSNPKAPSCSCSAPRPWTLRRPPPNQRIHHHSHRSPVDSLNATVALSVALFELQRRRR